MEKQSPEHEYKQSARKLNVIESLGGITGVLAHYKNGGSFTDIAGGDELTNPQLISFCEALTSKGMPAGKDIYEKMVLGADYKDTARLQDAVETYLKLKNNLSNRARKVLTRLENENDFNLTHEDKTAFVKTLFIDDYSFEKVRNIGKKTIPELTALKEAVQKTVNAGDISRLLAHYEKYGSFTDVPGVDELSNTRLISLCETLIKTGVPAGKDIHENKLPGTGIEDITWPKDTVRAYLNLKSNLSFRARTLLARLESEYDFNLTHAAKAAFIKTLFIEDYSFVKVKNIGDKTLDEITALKKEVQKIAFEKDYNKSDFDTYNLVNRIYCATECLIPKCEIEKAVNEKLYSLEKLISVYVLNSHWDEGQREFLHQYYFSENYHNLDDITGKISCRRRRMTFTNSMLHRRLIPKAAGVILKNLGDYQAAFPLLSGVNMVKFEKIAPFELNGIGYVPNQRWSVMVYSEIQANDFVHIDTAVFQSGKGIKSFIRVGICLFVSKTFMEVTHFNRLIKWLDKECYLIESEGMQVDTKHLTALFYSENKIEVSAQAMNDLHFIIETVRRRDWSAIADTVIRNKKRKYENDQTVSAAYRFLKESSGTKKLDEIVNFLKSEGIITSRVTLFKFMRQHKDKFRMLGKGNYGIKDSADSLQAGGTLRNIVAVLMENSSDPLHISDLLEVINKFQGTSEKSLHRNLKVDKDKRFIFFNCKFIGLASKKYDPHWHKLPQLMSADLTLSLNNKNLESKSEIAQYMHARYGYPEKHILYVLSRNKNKK